MPTLDGSSVVLRDIAPDDVGDLLALRRHPEIRHWWGEPDIGWPFTDLDAGTEKRWVAISPPAGSDPGAVRHIVGYVSAYQELDPFYRHAGMDLFVDPAQRGQGLGADIVATVARHLIVDIGHHRLVIDPASANVAAIRCYAKVGFREVGVLRQYERDPEGEAFHDNLLMELLADDLPPARPTRP